jgi:hypothetical protein
METSVRGPVSAWVAVGLSVSPNPLSAAGPSGYLCVADQIQGFAYSAQTHQWAAIRLKPDGRYIVRTLSERERGEFRRYNGNKGHDWTWGVFQFGKNYPMNVCKEIPLASLGLPEQELIEIGCESMFGSDFQMSRGLLRFTAMSAGDYLTRNSDNPDAGTPFLEIGRCSPF